MLLIYYINLYYKYMIHLLETQTLKKWLANDEVFLIDVREQSEYDEANIEGSILIPVGQITLSEVIKKNINNKKIVIHCKLGGRSMMACKKLVAENPAIEVWNVEGGITAWLNMDSKCNNAAGSCSVGNNKNAGCAS